MIAAMPDSARSDAFAHLAALAARPGAQRIGARLAAEPERARGLTFALDDLSLDFSRTAIDEAVLAALFALATAADLEGFRARLFAGAAVNVTEHRAAMHMALRAPADAGLRAALSAAARGRHAHWPAPNATACAISSPRCMTDGCAAPPGSASPMW